ncbi:MAG: nitroreductase family protein [Propionibacteriaceae bacterium]|nr:nitroreductase family protein [Propionibacteriaceae bacterium]
MNAALETIATRYSCRGFTNDPVSRADLEIITTAGVQAPSSRGNAPWYIAAITNREIIDDIRDSAWTLIQRHAGDSARNIQALGGDLFYNAQALIIVATRPTYDLTSEDFDAGLLTENICLAATSLGLGSCICGFSTQAFRDGTTNDRERFSKLLGFPWGYEMSIGILIGYPAAAGQQHPTDMSTIRFFE